MRSRKYGPDSSLSLLVLYKLRPIWKRISVEDICGTAIQLVSQTNRLSYFLDLIVAITFFLSQTPQIIAYNYVLFGLRPIYQLTTYASKIHLVSYLCYVSFYHRPFSDAWMMMILEECFFYRPHQISATVEND